MQRFLRRPLTDPARPEIWMLTALLALLVLGFAWTSDDARFTYRVLENLAGGYGPRFNPDERVMVFTHPLWFLLLSLPTLLRMSPFWSAIALGVVCAAATSVLLARLFAEECPESRTAFCAALLLCATSYGFVCFETSGLENSLSHLLLVAAALAHARRRPFAVLLLAALAVTNRMDQAPLFLPLALAAAARLAKDRGPMRAGCFALAAVAPFLAWECFSLVYYGFLFPNTAYAKLSLLNGTLSRGVLYLFDAAASEPAHALAGIALLIFALRRLLRRGAGGDGPTETGPLLLFGALLQLAYVIAIGGDFMRARFVTGSALAILIAGAIALGRERLRLSRFAAAVLVLVCGVDLVRGPLFASRFWKSGEQYRWIMNERQYYLRDGSLWGNDLAGLPPIFSPPAAADPARQMTFYVERAVPDAPPNTKFLMYRWAFISDPFMARVPEHDRDSNVGHIIKPVPAEYLALEKASRTATYSEIPYAQLEAAYQAARFHPWRDAKLERLYFVIAAITRAPIFSPLRLRAMRDWYSGAWPALSPEELRPYQEACKPYW